MFLVSEADRCQQVLLSHQRQKRRGVEWLSPESKTTSRQSSILDYVVCNLYVACACGWPYKHSYRYVWVQLRKSIDDMETQPMMEMPQFYLENMPLNLKLTSDHLSHLLIMICTCNGAYLLFSWGGVEAFLNSRPWLNLIEQHCDFFLRQQRFKGNQVKPPITSDKVSPQGLPFIESRWTQRGCN